MRIRSKRNATAPRPCGIKVGDHHITINPTHGTIHLQAWTGEFLGPGNGVYALDLYLTEDHACHLAASLIDAARSVR